MSDTFFDKNKFSIAVHLHIYYENMWPFIKSYLQNLENLKYDLFVTLVKKNSALEEEIRSYAPNCRIFVIENRGYDVGPFVYFLHQINLDDYDLILKIHTKSRQGNVLTSINGKFFSRRKWVDVLLNSLIGSKQMIATNLANFENKKELGMIASKYLIAKDKDLSAEMRQAIKVVLQRLGYSDNKEIMFVPGTMFWVRASLFKSLKHNFVLEDFSSTDGKIRNGTFAHVMERVFGAVVLAQNFTIEGFDHCHCWQLRSPILELKRFLFQKKITKNNYELVKVCRIPVYRRRLSDKS